MKIKKGDVRYVAVTVCLMVVLVSSFKLHIIAQDSKGNAYTITRCKL